MKKIVLIIIVLLGLIFGYLAYDSYGKGKIEEKKEAKVIKEKKLDNMGPSMMGFISNNQIRRFLAIKKYPTNYIFTNAMFENDLLLWVLDKTCPEYGECLSIKTKDLDKVFKNTFNLENLAYNDYVCPVDGDILYKYDKNKGEYDLVSGEVHKHDNIYTYYEPIYVKYDSFINIGNDYILTLYELYYDFKEGMFIGDSPDASLSIFPVDKYINESTNEVDLDGIIHDYNYSFVDNKKKYTKYVYTFRKNDDEFYLYKYEIEKPWLIKAFFFSFIFKLNDYWCSFKVKVFSYFVF